MWEDMGQGEGTEWATNLTVLDGTWSKAKLIYFGDPYLQDVLHY